jgi:MFS family permease
MLKRIPQLEPIPRPLAALYVGAFVNRFGTFVVPFLVLYLTRSGFTIAQAGLAASAYGVGSLVASLVGGQLADRFGLRITIAGSMLASAFIMLALSQARALGLITLLSGCAGLAAEMYRPAAGALIAELLPAERRRMGYAYYRLAINVGVAAGAAAAGLLADRSYTLLFVGDALTSLVFGVIIWFALPHAPSTGTHRDTHMEAVPRSSHEHVSRGARRAFRLFLIAFVLVSFVYFQSLSTLGLQVHARGLSNAVYGALLSLNGVLILIFEVPLTALLRRVQGRIIMSGFLCLALGFGLTAVATTLPFLIVTVAIWTLGEMLYSPASAAYVANLAPANQRGRYQGLWGLTAGMGLILAPAIGTRLFAWSPGALWLFCAALGVLSAIIMGFISHQRGAC